MTLRASLTHDQSGSTAVEFAIIAPILILLVAGGIELVHMKFVQSVLVGEMQKAGRNMSLEGAADATKRTTILNAVTSSVQSVAPGATMTYTIKSFHDYSNAANPSEEFADANHDGSCDNGESFVDSNDNGHWDADGSVDGRGGAKDVVVLTGVLTYPHLVLGDSTDITMQASTFLRNQPSNAQAQPATRTCT